ncbi:MAG: hypothetical protein H6627_06155 [Calditrichae bacterium]|nr:hypothetical protein [Calditrichota bacterium]MCB9058131.1 hypothetical protein [Calditrichia bacterium]
MKILQFSILLLWAGISALLAQSSEILKADIRSNPDNRQDYEMDMEVQLDNSLSDGFFIELPEGMKTVVKSIRKDGENLWLVNSRKAVDQKNVIAWYAAENGVYFSYTLDELSGSLVIELVPDNKKLKRFDNFEAKLFPATREAENIVAQSQETARSTVSVKQTIQGNE